MTTIRSTFLELAETSHAAITNPTVAERWNEPSALESLSIGALAAHLARAVYATVSYLEADRSGPATGDDLIGPDTYFSNLPLTQAGSAVNRGVVERAETAAAAGFATVAADLKANIETAHFRLENEPADRVVEVFGSAAMLLDDYLQTRVLEMVVHLDDLSASLDDEPVPVDSEALNMTACLLARIACRRSGPEATIRAMARHERSREPVFPVF